MTREPITRQIGSMVSIVMPAYNAAAYIKESVSSILLQDYENFELIIVDDGSSDGTPELVENLDSRIVVLRQKNAGPAAARNLGLSAARGEYIAFLDADDLWTPGKLRLQVEFLQRHLEYGMVYGGFLRWQAAHDGHFDPPPRPLGNDAAVDATVAEQSGWIYVPLLFDNIVHIITAMVRRDLIAQVGGFDAKLPTGEDYDFWLRLSRHAQAAKLARTLAYYRIHNASITHKPRMENNEYRALRAALDRWGAKGPNGVAASAELLRMRLFKLNFSHGYQHVRVGSARVAAKAFWSAVRIRPTHLKSWGYLFFSGIKSLFFI